jgi:hypothetical protein
LIAWKRKVAASLGVRRGDFRTNHEPPGRYPNRRFQSLNQVQGVSGALAYEAEKVRGKLNDAQQALLFPILARLIRRGELGGATRRLAQRDEFDAEKQMLIAHLSSEEGGRASLDAHTR